MASYAFLADSRYDQEIVCDWLHNSIIALCTEHSLINVSFIGTEQGERVFINNCGKRTIWDRPVEMGKALHISQY